MQILDLLKNPGSKKMEKTERIQRTPEQEKAELAIDLAKQREWVEHKIRLQERKNVDDKVRTALRQLQDVHEAIADMQYSLNMLWKRSHQITEELKEALEVPMPSLPSHHSQNPQ